MAFKSYLIIVHASQVNTARLLASQLGWTHEFSVPCSSDKEPPPTHYISHGQIVPTEAERSDTPRAATSVEALQIACASNNLSVSFIETTGLNPVEVLAEQALQIIQPAISLVSS